MRETFLSLQGDTMFLQKKPRIKKPQTSDIVSVPDFVSAAAAVFAKITIRHYNGSCFVLNGNEPSNEILK